MLCALWALFTCRTDRFVSARRGRMLRMPTRFRASFFLSSSLPLALGRCRSLFFPFRFLAQSRTPFTLSRFGGVGPRGPPIGLLSPTCIRPLEHRALPLNNGADFWYYQTLEHWQVYAGQLIGRTVAKGSYVRPYPFPRVRSARDFNKAACAFCVGTTSAVPLVLASMTLCHFPLFSRRSISMRSRK